MKVFFGFIAVCCLIVLVIKFAGCTEEPSEPPLTNDGNISLKISILWDKDGRGTDLVKIGNARVTLRSEYGTTEYQTDKDGVLIIKHLPIAAYSISVIAYQTSDSSTVLSGYLDYQNLDSSKTFEKTIYVTSNSYKGIVINELYTGGPINSINYFWDQYIELYNSSDETKYLDGIQIIKMGSSEDVEINFGRSDAGSDPDLDGDIERVMHISKFPGRPGEKNYPFPPKTFLVIACDAIDHSKYTKNALNLTNANWEFYNPYSPDDIDNPKVPNVENIMPELTTDFNMSTNIGIIIIADGSDTNYQDGVDISTILDGIEYDNRPDDRKTLDPRVNKGNIICPPIRTGRSIQRIQPGFNSKIGMIDFKITLHCTPGYQ